MGQNETEEGVGAGTQEKSLDAQFNEATAVDKPLKDSLTPTAFEDLRKQCQDPMVAQMMMGRFFQKADRLDVMHKQTVAIEWGREMGISSETMRASWMKQIDEAINASEK